MNEFNPSITLRKLLLHTQDSPAYKNRFEYAERDCLIERMILKPITTYSRFNTPRSTLEVYSTSMPRYNEYLKETNAGTIHQYPVTMSFFFPNKAPKIISLDTPVKIRTGKGGKWPSEAARKILLKQVKSEKRPNGKFASVNDAIAQRYQINGDFYWRVAYNRGDHGFLHGRYYPPDGYPKAKKTLPKKAGAPRPKERKKAKASKAELFLTKHEIAVLQYLTRSGKIANNGKPFAAIG